MACVPTAVAIVCLLAASAAARPWREHSGSANNGTTANGISGYLFGGWAFVLHDPEGWGGGTPPAFLDKGTNIITLAFADPLNLTIPSELSAVVQRYRDTHTVMLSVGGEDYGDHWVNSLTSTDAAVAMGITLATFRQRYGVHGIDIDAEEQVETEVDPQLMATMIRTLRQHDPGVLISLDVYGVAEGRNFHNYLVNNLVNGDQTIDWINIMGYGGYDNDVTYIENYTKAPKSQWDHPIDAAVAAHRVVIGMKATGGFSNCNPPDYAQMVTYIKANDLLGIQIWPFLFNNSSLTSSWWNPDCTQAYINTCSLLLSQPCS